MALSIFLEYIPGGSIKALINKFGALEESVAQSYTRQLLLGLEYLHRHGIAHRDMKGANCLVSNDGVIKLADFGASRRWRPNGNSTGLNLGPGSAGGSGSEGVGAGAGAGPAGSGSPGVNGEIKGTPSWMAPEVIRDQQTQTINWKKADVWSLGCTTVEMTTGKPPWNQFNNPVTVLYQIACTDARPEYPNPASTELTDFLDSCLTRDPVKRTDITSLLLHPFVASGGFMAGHVAPAWGGSSKADIAQRPRPSTVSTTPFGQGEWAGEHFSAYEGSVNNNPNGSTNARLQSGRPNRRVANHSARVNSRADLGSRADPGSNPDSAKHQNSVVVSRRSTSTTNTTSSSSNNNNNKKRSLAQMALASNNDEYKLGLEVQIKRKKLLEADKSLYKQYHDLVLTSKLLDEDDFWSSHSSSFDNFNLDGKNTLVSRGRSSMLLSDVQHSSFKVNFKLTADIIHEIFLMYPAVRKAFDIEVPLRLTEQKFWHQYFQSEFYTRDKGGKSSLVLTDDIFSRYESLINQDNNDNDNSGLKNVSTKIENKSGLVLCHSDVDLTATDGDYHPRDAVLNQRILNPGSDGINKNSAKVIDKYNRHSHLVMEEDLKYKNTNICNKNNEININKSDVECNELNRHRKVSYIPLVLAHTSDVTSLSSMTNKTQVVDDDDDNNDGYNAFGRSSNAVCKSQVLSVVSSSSIGLLSNLNSLFSAPTRALDVLQNDIASLKSVTSVAKHAAASAGGLGLSIGRNEIEQDTVIGSNGKNNEHLYKNRFKNINIDVVEGLDLSESFKHELFERFTVTTELLRHFYKILSREGSLAPLLGTVSYDKAKKLMDRLVEIHQSLLNKKRNITSQIDNNTTSSSVAVITDICKLIDRAHIKWTTYQEAMK
jgi:serine/threonine protein kinase